MSKIYILQDSWVCKEKRTLQYCVAESEEEAWKIFHQSLGITNENLYVIQEVSMDFIVAHANELIETIKCCKKLANDIIQKPILGLAHNEE